MRGGLAEPGRFARGAGELSVGRSSETIGAPHAPQKRARSGTWVPQELQCVGVASAMRCGYIVPGVAAARPSEVFTSPAEIAARLV